MWGCVCVCVSVGQVCSLGKSILYWSASSVFNCTSGYHLASTPNLSIVSFNLFFLFTLSHQPLLHPIPHHPTPYCLSLSLSPSHLAFRPSVSLLFLSLSINLVCLGWMEGGGRTEAEDGRLNEREVRVRDKVEDGDYWGEKNKRHSPWLRHVWEDSITPFGNHTFWINIPFNVFYDMDFFFFLSCNDGKAMSHSC